MSNSHDVNPAAARSSVAYAEVPVLRPEHGESALTRLIEQQTAKVPSALFLTASFAAALLSLSYELKDRPRPSRFVGMWVAPLLVMGVYNKLVKMLGPR